MGRVRASDPLAWEAWACLQARVAGDRLALKPWQRRFIAVARSYGLLQQYGRVPPPVTVRMVWNSPDMVAALGRYARAECGYPDPAEPVRTCPAWMTAAPPPAGQPAGRAVRFTDQDHGRKKGRYRKW